MDDVFAESDSSGVRADGDSKLSGHEKDAQDLVNSGETARVDLADIDGLSLEKLLENHPVVRVLSRGCSDASRQGSASAGKGRARRVRLTNSDT